MVQSRGSRKASKQHQSIKPPRTNTERALIAIWLDDEVEFAEAVEFLVSKVPRGGDSLRQAKDKVGQRLRYALRQGHLVGRGPESKTLLLAEVAAWARIRWKKKKVDLPLLPIVGAVDVTLDGAGLSAEGRVIFRTVAECESALQAALKRESLLMSELTAARLEIERLRPLEYPANKYEKIRRKNQESAKKKRKKAY